jgi:hypothetical protein
MILVDYLVCSGLRGTIRCENDGQERVQNVIRHVNRNKFLIGKAFAWKQK